MIMCGKSRCRSLLLTFVLMTTCFDGTGILLAQDRRTPSRTQHGKVAFFREPAGTVAFLPDTTDEDNAKEFTQFRLLPESGSYILPKQTVYWFVVNHRVPKRAGEVTYVGVGAVSFVDPHIKTLLQPVSTFRNEGWFRPEVPAYAESNGKDIPLRLTPEEFFSSHVEAGSLEDLDQKLGLKWHGNYRQGASSSWAERALWDLRDVLRDDGLRKSFGIQIPKDSRVRFDAKLLLFEYTKKKTSDRPVIFELDGDNRIATYVRIFSPDNPKFERHYYLAFSPDAD